MNKEKELVTIAYSITNRDLQEQAEIYLGRRMSERELPAAINLFSQCITDTIHYTYSTVFDLLKESREFGKGKIL